MGGGFGGGSAAQAQAQAQSQSMGGMSQSQAQAQAQASEYTVLLLLLCYGGCAAAYQGLQQAVFDLWIRLYAYDLLMECGPLLEHNSYISDLEAQHTCTPS
jgi:hypothetical protein